MWATVEAEYDYQMTALMMSAPQRKGTFCLSNGALQSLAGEHSVSKAPTMASHKVSESRKTGSDTNVLYGASYSKSFTFTLLT